MDSIDHESFYNDDIYPSVRIHRHLQYEKYLLEEVMPLIYFKNGGSYVETAGCSMGAYHALNLALKYPWLFKKAVGMSGRYDLTEAPRDFKDLMDGFHNNEVHFNMPAQYIANLNDHDWLNNVRNMEIIIAVGKIYPFESGNRYFSQLLWDKGIPNQFHP